MPTLVTRGAASVRGFGFAGTTPVLTDPYFNYTTLLLHGNGTNGGQNNTFLDSGTANGGVGFDITRNGNTTQGTFSPFSQTGWSNYFDGSSDYLAYSGITMGTNAFTIECFFMSNSFGSVQTPFGCSSTTGNLSIRINNATTIQVDSWNVGNSQFTVPTMSVGQWYHLVITRDSSNRLTVFLNGTRSSTGSVTNSTDYGATKDIGWQNADYPSLGLNGYMSQVRIVNGQAVYDPTQTTITVPTAPLTTTGYGSVSQGITASNTKLLTCQSNYFVDNSSSPFTLTPNGSVSVQAFSPFAPTAAYSASTVGGSGYFDGSGDYLSIPSNTAFAFGTGDFTVEGWIYYASVASNSVRILATAGAAADCLVEVSTSSELRFYDGSTTTTFTGSTTQANAWNHIAVTRSGTSLRGYINGAQVGSTVTNSANIANTQAINFPATTNYAAAACYISNVRYLKGTALYTGSTYTIPTAPLTNISNTSLLCNFTNAAIIDNTAKNVLETVGNAQISTTQSKFGGASISFASSGDGLNSRDSDLFDMSSGDFTVEMWARANNLSGEQFLMGQNNYSTYYAPFRIQFDGTQLRAFMSTSGSSWGLLLEAGSALSNNTWYHIALVRYGTSFKLYVNGNQYDSGTLSGALYNSSDIMRIGWAAISLGNFTFNGYIDDLRITKGIARYTSNFTPQTSQWQDQ